MLRTSNQSAGQIDLGPGTTTPGDGLVIAGLYGVTISLYAGVPGGASTFSGGGDLLCWLFNTYQNVWTQYPALNINMSQFSGMGSVTATVLHDASRLGFLINWLASSVTMTSTDFLLRLDGGPGFTCTSSSFVATKNTGADYTLTGDAGVRFGDGTIQNTAATSGGLQATGSPLQIAYFADGGWIGGNAALTYKADLTQVLTTLPIVSSVAASGTGLQLTEGAYVCLNGAPCTASIRTSSGGTVETFVSSPAAIHLSAASGQVATDQGGFVVDDALNSNLEIYGDADLNDVVTLQGAGTSTTVPISIKPKGTAGLGVGFLTAASVGLDIRTNKISTEGDLTSTVNSYNDVTAYNASPASGVALGFRYTAGGSLATGGGLEITKENGTDGNVASYLSLLTRPAAGNPTEYLRMSSLGLLSAYGTSPSFWLDARPNVATAVGTDGSASALFGLYNSYTNYDASPVSGIIFGTEYHSNGSVASGGAITVNKANATDNNTAYWLALHTRAAGGNVAEAARLTSSKYLWVGTTTDIGANSFVGTTDTATSLQGQVFDIWNTHAAGSTGQKYSVLGLRRGAQGAADGTARQFGNPYVNIGGTEYGTTTGDFYTIGFGYSGGDDTSGGQPCEVGYVSTNNGSNTKGDLIFGCRDTTSAGDPPVERVRITSAGVLKVGSDPAVAVHAAQSAVNQAMEYGTATLDGATPSAVTVTFATAFGTAPKCTCTVIDTTGASNCTLNAAAGTTSVVLKGPAASSATVDWICIGIK
jgi:hypothetical protein